MSTSSNRICISVLPTCGYALLFYNRLATRTFLISTAVMPDHRFYLTITCTSLSCRLWLFYTLKLVVSISIMGLDRTYHAHHCIFSFTYSFCLFISCGRLSWLPVSFFYCTLNRPTYCRIVSYRIKHFSIISKFQYEISDTPDIPIVYIGLNHKQHMAQHWACGTQLDTNPYTNSLLSTT